MNPLSKSGIGSGVAFDKKLAAYALAGAAVLALPGVARADDVTVVPVGFTGTSASNGSYSFNLSGASSADITISAENTTDPVFGSPMAQVTASSITSAGLLVDESDFVQFLAPGTQIGSSSPWAQSGKLESDGSVFSAAGDWNAGTEPSTVDGYLGFYFTGADGVQYGWADLSVTVDNSPSASFTVNEYAYQDTAGDPIAAGQTSDTPEPSSLSLLVLGAAGLAALRLRRNAANA